MFTIMVAEDDSELRELFCTVLRKHGYQTVPAENGADALQKLDNAYVDLIISDIMMPNMDGYDFISAVRDMNREIPVLIVTARDSLFDMKKGFQAGTDDYMVKPIQVDEMILRVGALLRRAQIISERKLTAGSTTLDYDALTVTCGGDRQILPQKEFYLLYKLISSPNHIFTRNQLMDEIWGLDSETEPRTVDVHIGRIRDRFNKNPDFEIVTVRGLGYKAVRKN